MMNIEFKFKLDQFKFNNKILIKCNKTRFKGKKKRTLIIIEVKKKKNLLFCVHFCTKRIEPVDLAATGSVSLDPPATEQHPIKYRSSGSRSHAGTTMDRGNSR